MPLLLIVQACWSNGACPSRRASGPPVGPFPRPSYPSQCGQDMFLDTAVFGGAGGGVYLDIGCNDGRSNSNTWFFNQRRGWRGVCVEADPKMFRRIPIASGRSDAIHAAASARDGTAEFSVVNVPDGGLSGLSNTLDHARARGFGPTRRVTVPTLSPRTLLKRHYNATLAIDYVSIDVEGHELEVLRAWPGGALRGANAPWCVNVFTIENNHYFNRTEGILPQIMQILGGQYTHVRSMGVDELFVRRTPCATASVPLRPPPYMSPSRPMLAPLQRRSAAPNARARATSVPSNRVYGAPPKQPSWLRARLTG